MKKRKFVIKLLLLVNLLSFGEICGFLYNSVDAFSSYIRIFIPFLIIFSTNLICSLGVIEKNGKTGDGSVSGKTGDGSNNTGDGSVCSDEK